MPDLLVALGIFAIVGYVIWRIFNGRPYVIKPDWERRGVCLRKRHQGHDGWML